MHQLITIAHSLLQNTNTTPSSLTITLQHLISNTDPCDLLQPPTNGFASTLALLERLLLKLFNKKIRKNHLSILWQRQEKQDLLQILVYILLCSQFCSSLVEHILYLGECEQVQLMGCFRRVEQMVQECWQVRQGIEKIDNLCQYLNNLKESIFSKEQEQQQHQIAIQQLKAQNVLLSKQNSRYLEQKQQANYHLQVSSLSEYTQLCQLFQFHNQLIQQRNLTQISERQQLQHHSSLLKHQLLIYNAHITSQIQTLSHLKLQCQLQLQCEVQPATYSILLEEKLPLQQHTLLLNLPQNKQIQTDRTYCSTQRSYPNNLGQEVSLEQLEEQEELKKQIISQLRKNIQIELSKNRKLSGKIAQIRREHQNNINKYQQFAC